MNMTTKDTLKEVRIVATRNGLTFKVDNRRYINGKPAYRFIDKETKETVLSNMNLSMALNNVCSGFIDSYNPANKSFDGVG
tara:strand:+ start:843 stop:1085 length:243 start_codon:yes stop_codon:yes gene_type:complete